MDAGRYPDDASTDAADEGVPETTLADDDAWPVAEQYRVEPTEPADEEGTVVLRDARGPDEPHPRRFPPPLGRSLTAALVGVLLAALLIPAGAWLATRTEDETASATGADTSAPPAAPPATTESQPPPSATSDVPDVTGQLLPEARGALEEADLRVRFERVDSERRRNEVLEQEPAAGAEAAPGSIVVLAVSAGERQIAVPDVEGASAQDAATTLRGAGLRSRTSVVPTDATPGTVIGQSPAAGEEVEAETVVVLQVAAARTVPVPDLVGMRSSEARNRLQTLGLRFTQRPVESSLPAGEVLSQSPAAGAELREGGVVILRVSTGSAQVEVPDVAGLNEAAASQELELAGFVVRVVDEPTVEPDEDGVVLGQSPPAGTSRRKGATVTITVGRLS